MNNQRKTNCWEFFSCGRGPSGPGALKMSECRAAREIVLDGINGGINGGRACWAVAGTMGVDEPECSTSRTCGECEFHRHVVKEEMPELLDSYLVLEKLGYADLLTLTSKAEIDEWAAGQRGELGSADDG